MLLLVGAATAIALVRLVPVASLVGTHRRAVVRGLAGATLAVVAVGLVGLVLAVGNPVSWAGDQLGGSGEVVNDPGRLGSLETNNRTVWWGEAWQVFRANPAGGTGARTFEIARKRYRDNAENVSEPHSVPLQLLADGGIPAFALGIGFVVALVLGLRIAVRRLVGEERAAAVGLLALPLAFGLHTLVDYDLDFLAVAAPTALVAAALLGAGRPRALARSRWLVAASAVVAAAVAVWVLAAPELSSRAVDRAYRQADAGDLDAAAASARRAQSLNPLSLDPLYARATVASLAGDDRGGGAALRASDAAPAREPRPLVPARALPPDLAPRPVRRLLRAQRCLHARSAQQPLLARKRARHRPGRGQRPRRSRLRTVGKPGRPAEAGHRNAAAAPRSLLQAPTTSTALAPWSCEVWIPSSGPTMLMPRSRASRRPSPSKPRRYMTRLRVKSVLPAFATPPMR